jgi:hypothetical protein
MFIRNLLLFTLGFFFTFISSLYAAEIEGIHLLKNNALSFKIGPHIYGDNDYMDFWKVDKVDFIGATGELAYERKISQKLSIELSLGFFRSTDDHKDVLFSGDSSDLTIKNLYLSPSAKWSIPIHNSFVFYLGIGPDYYRTRKFHFYKFGSIHYEISETFNTFGLHGLIGVEYYFFKQPVQYGFYDLPVSLIFEYKYSWANIDDADKVLIDNINNFFGTTHSYNDMDVGGHIIFLGIRYHF